MIESFPAGTSETAKKLLSVSVNTGNMLGDRLSDIIDRVVDSIFK